MSLTKREALAGMAMQGLLAGRYQGGQIRIAEDVDAAVQIADALIAELDRSQSSK